jgi:hypothetical protein
MEAMQQRLTLRMDRALVRRAKAYAQRTGTSVSALVADFFALLDESDGQGEELTPTVRSLVGILSGTELDEESYREHIAEKHA